MSDYLDSKYPFQPSNLQGNITTNKVNDDSVRYGWNYRIHKKMESKWMENSFKETSKKFRFMETIRCFKCPAFNKMELGKRA